VALRKGGSEVWQHTSADLYQNADLCQAAVNVHVPALSLPRLHSEMLVLKSLLHHSCPRGVVLLHMKNVHKPSNRADLTSHNFLTTHLIIYNCLPKGFLLVFDPLC